MSDLISRADAISVLDNFTQTDALGHTPRQIVEALPSAQPKKGKWEDRSFTGLHRYRCDQCGGLSYFAGNFCPNCGADMRGEEDE